MKGNSSNIEKIIRENLNLILIGAFLSAVIGVGLTENIKFLSEGPDDLETRLVEGTD
ncbi:MAG: hypothetical protein OEY17_07365 [Nitrosopumilus sp.]|nr:hypothetical protein [Nitrosopumilus sp.]MDH5659144.1 hypothetical protein [Nitrosopumilus sp.]